MLKSNGKYQQKNKRNVILLWLACSITLDGERKKRMTKVCLCLNTYNYSEAPVQSCCTSFLRLMFSDLPPKGNHNKINIIIMYKGDQIVKYSLCQHRRYTGFNKHFIRLKSKNLSGYNKKSASKLLYKSEALWIFGYMHPRSFLVRWFIFIL